MASLGSWIASGLCFTVFLLVRRLSLGLAAPAIVAISLACFMIWTCLWRLPELKNFKVDETTSLPIKKLLSQVQEAVAEEDGRDDSCVASNDVVRGHPSEADGPAAACEFQDDSSDDARCSLQEEEVKTVYDVETAQKLRLQGNEFFKAGKIHDAREAYSEAIYLTPKEEAQEKAVLYANRAACSQKLERWEETVDDCRIAIELDASYLKAYQRRSNAFEKMQRWHDAAEDLKKAIELDGSLKGKEARHLAVLEERAKEQFEKDKEEMMGKLKDLGNMVLGKFGMSVDNFKLEQVDQRAALFGNRSVGRGRGDDLKAAYTREVMEKQNDDAIGDLEAKVAQLKGITMNIKDETAQSLSFLDTLGAGFEKAGDMLKSTVGNLRSMVHQHGGQSFCTKVMAIVVVVVLMLYLLRNLRSSPETSPP